MTAPSSALPTALPPAKLLLVDDHPANLTALEAIFATLECELVFATSGEEALKALLRNDFAAILLDVQMPGLDGFQTASLIRNRKRSRDIPIIFLTAVSKEREFVFRGYEHGAVDYLVKPFHPDILRAKVAVFVELYQRREQVRLQGEELARREREALERASSLRYQQLVDLMPQVVFANRPDGSMYLVNRVWTEYTGLDADKTVAGEWLQHIHPDDLPKVSSRWESALATEASFEMELRIRSAAGEYRWFLVRANPERGEAGNIVGWIGTSTDIDDQRKIREALAEALTAKDDFLAAASHELRTPLAAAKAQVQLSQRRIGPDEMVGGANLGRALRIVGNQINRMTRLVEDLLDVSRLQTGRLSLQLGEFDLIERLRGEIERLSALSPQHPMSLEAPERISIVADRDRIDQVVINLLTNAVRYSPGGGTIAIRVSEEGEQIELAVSDKGVGIPKEKQLSIFERFGRAHGTKYGGLGLGLTIAQGIVEQHGGRIWCESSGNPGEGTTFRVQIPVRADVRPDRHLI